MAATAKTSEGMKTVDESDVGISCFISQLPGFRGILKQRLLDQKLSDRVLFLLNNDFCICLALKFTLLVNKWIKRFNLYENLKLFGYN